MGPDPDEDAEGEEEPEDAAEDMNQDEMEEDKGIYCFCRKMSYGEVRFVSSLSYNLFLFFFALSLFRFPHCHSTIGCRHVYPLSDRQEGTGFRLICTGCHAICGPF